MNQFTKRLFLREMTADDFSALFAVLGDSDIMRYYPYVFDESRVRRWITANQERYATFGFGLWAVTLADTGKLIGDCGLTMQNINGIIKPEIGYHIAKAYQRQGYAKEAAAFCRDWTFENTPFLRLFSYMKQENVPSAKTAQRIGMTFVETFEDAEHEMTAVYAISREEWEQQYRMEKKKAD